MVARMLIVLLALLVGGGLTGTSVMADTDPAILREDDAGELVVSYDDDDDDDGNTHSGGGTDGTFNSGTGDSNDGTNSKVTPVTWDKDKSQDDLTKDKTKDGPGGKKRDWSKNKTNDQSKNDSR